MIAAAHAAPAARASGTTEAVLTHGTIALRNLDAQIDGLEPDATLRSARVEERACLIDLLALRGSILGTIADCERAQELAEQLVCDAVSDAAVFLARARTRALFHRFGDALDDLDVAERPARRCPSFESLGALSTLCAESGDTERAMCLHAQSIRQYRGVSPLPLAV